MLPATINKIVRATFAPKNGNSDAIRDVYWNIINHIMNRRIIDVIKFILKAIDEITVSITLNLYFAPYIMSLILMKTNFRQSSCECKNFGYKPFSVNLSILRRGQGGQSVPAAQEDQHEEPQHYVPPPQPAPESVPPQWALLAGFFDPYMASIQQSIQQQFTSFQQNLPQSFYQPIIHATQNAIPLAREDIAAINTKNQELNDMFQTLSLGQQSLQQQFNSFSDQFTTFSDHFYSIYLRPSPPPLQDD